jgi:alpha-beta hydrolase superfamily lysophospholipase
LTDRDVEIPAGAVTLSGRLTVPDAPHGVVVFVHGSGSSRHSLRNRYVADVLSAAGLVTLLFDLLTSAEESDRTNVFDIELLASRLGDATRWIRAEPVTADLPLGYFGASTGAAAALWEAAGDPNVAAVVSRGGRPDLATPRLGAVTAPTLLIVGGRDDVVLRLNRDAQRRLGGDNELAVVPGATHLFEEPGTLATVAELAREWFSGHLRRRAG